MRGTDGSALMLAVRARSECARTIHAVGYPPIRPASFGGEGDEGEQKEFGVPIQLWRRLIGALLLGMVTACAGPEPLLRSNKHLQLYGKQMAQEDIGACQHKAEEAGLRSGAHRSGNAAAGAGLGLTLGAAVGASAGVIGGGAGVAIGAAAGGGLGLIIGLAGGAYKPLVPEPPYADAVVKCLIEKGYEVSGWQ